MSILSKSFALSALLLSMAGCADCPVTYEDVLHDMPVAVTCHTQPVQVPVWESSKLQKSDSLFRKVQAYLMETEQHKAYESQLAAANKACQ